MGANIPFNPMVTTNGKGSFNVASTGYIQGQALDSPAIRNSLAGGVLDTAETIVMWGGVGIYEDIPGAAGTPQVQLGGIIGRATNLTLGAAKSLTGFSVFDQDHSMINTPQSPVPCAPSGGEVNFYRRGSGARIAVAIDPSLVDLEGNIITSQVSWDFNAQRLVPYAAAYPQNALVGISWAGGVVTGTTTTAHGIAVGDDFSISGVTPAGYNGSFTALAGTAGSVLKYALATNPGIETVLGQLDAGGGALGVRVLAVQVGGCMVVDYNPVTKFATWDRDGSCAVILI